MFAVCECPPDPALGLLGAALVALLPAYVAAACLWKVARPVVGPALSLAFHAPERCLSAAPVSLSGLFCRARGAARRAVLSAVAWLSGRSELVFAAACRVRACRARYSGLAQYEEWAAEIAEIPSASARRVLMSEIRRYYPSDRLVRRARSLRGKRCVEVRAAERARRLIEG